MNFEDVCSFENLYAAHRAARLGKRHKSDVIAFEMDLAWNLWDLKTRLENATYTVGDYRHFTVRDPKFRDIQALSYRDRVVQQSLCANVLAPFFERRLIHDNTACRVGKGTHFGLARLTRFLTEHYRRHGTGGWILKADVRKYFASVDHAVLLARLRRSVPDVRVLALLEQIVRSYEGDSGRGLPMGNQTSQWFALYYLDPVDRLVKERLRVRHYIRYMDDMVLVHPDREFLKECRDRIREFCETDLKLELNDKTQLFPLRHGVDWLGWHFYVSATGKVVRKLRNTSKKRLKRRMKGLQKRFASGGLSVSEIRQRLASTTGHLLHGHTWRLRTKVYGLTGFVRKSAVSREAEASRSETKVERPAH